VSGPKDSREIRREEFTDGSAIVTYADGSMLVLESNLARGPVLAEPHLLSRRVNYNDPSPPPSPTPGAVAFPRRRPSHKT